jgi:hypothetical protein
VVAGLEDDVDQIEATVFSETAAPAQRDQLGTVLEANMAVLSVEQARISNRQNATMSSSPSWPPSSCR